jgi:Protein of unknown function (DUF2510)
MTDQTSTRSVGWHLDEGDPSQERYWDGFAWIGTPRPSAQILRAAANAGQELLGAARNRLLLGTGIALVSAVIGFRALDSDGGTVWTGGFIVAALLYVNAIKAYRQARGLGAQLSTNGMALAGGLLLLGILPGLVFGSQLLNGRNGSEAVVDSACWTAPDAIGMTLNVPCSDPTAEYVVQSIVTREADCPRTAPASVAGDSLNEFLCLARMSP